MSLLMQCKNILEQILLHPNEYCKEALQLNATICLCKFILLLFELCETHAKMLFDLLKTSTFESVRTKQNFQKLADAEKDQYEEKSNAFINKFILHSLFSDLKTTTYLMKIVREAICHLKNIYYRKKALEQQKQAEIKRREQERKLNEFIFERKVFPSKSKETFEYKSSEFVVEKETFHDESNTFAAHGETFEYKPNKFAAEVETFQVESNKSKPKNIIMEIENNILELEKDIDLTFILLVTLNEK
ncbi:unnamed protein product [Rotaria sp. Silwood2]|nr:unnamed protein product [Rotaria sp. Silwood2]